LAWLVLHIHTLALKRYFIQLAYKGTNYCGWQRQNNAPSIQEDLEKALSLKLKSNINVVGCGRTDTGVHAHNYFAHFETESGFDPEDLSYKLNSLLKSEIAIKSIFEVNQNAHARFDASSRSYRYFIHFEKDPFSTDTCWYLYNSALDVGKMNHCAEMLTEISDFSAFEKAGSDNKTSICKVDFAEWFNAEHGIYFEIRADRFLRNIVRAIVGTLVDVGLGKTSIENFKTILSSRNRSQAGASVPAQGLFLWDITYPLNTRKL
jgi:tRNA pseudouridine38-40 synthase